MRNLNISWQLALSLGVVFFSVLLLGAMAWFQTYSLWAEIQGLYDHPLQVRRALGALQADILMMENGTKDQLTAQNDLELQKIQQEIDLKEADANQQFQVLFNQYLGPRSDIEEAYQYFVQWRSIRDETLRLLRNGQPREAEDRITANGVSALQVEKILGHVQDISDFATARGDQFMQDAQVRRNTLLFWLAIMLGVTLVLSTGIGFLLLKGIREPLIELAAVTGQYRLGNLDARSRYTSNNELGKLAASFNSLAATIQADTQNRNNLAGLVDDMLQEDELVPFFHKLLQGLLAHTGSQAGAVYLLNEQKTTFEHLTSIGLTANGRASFSAPDYEGEAGSVLATGKVQLISKISPQTRFTFAAAGGDFTPCAILTLPILAGREVVGIVSLASLAEYPASSVRLVQDLLGALSARTNGLLAFRQVRQISNRLEVQNRELAEQARELNQQNIELERQKDELDEANRLKTIFLSNMSHELRTPLNSVIALTGVLSRRLRGAIPEDEYSYLEVIERNGRNLLSLINDILDLSRIEAGKEEINLSSFSIHHLVEEVEEMLKPQALEKGIDLVNGVAGDLPVLTSDYIKCRHILQNLVSNAVKFTPDGWVEITAGRSGDAIQIRVADTGIGIPAEQLAHIFDEFRQGDESTSRKYGGAGLGLAIARKYARLLQGDIQVTSTPGNGSTFTLSLPLEFYPTAEGFAKTPAVHVTGSAAARKGAPQGNTTGKTILLVEDSEPAIIQLKEILVGEGYHILLARNGSAALSVLQSTHPDAMILDLMMPEVDGFQVLRMVREQERTASLPVLILTAKQVTREEMKFLKGNHVHQLIQKGDINRSALLEAVARMVLPPVVTPPVLPQSVQPQPENQTFQPAEPPTILVIEDNPDNQLTLKAMLKDTCNLLEAADGPSGLELARSHQIDLILLDLSLPEQDGYLVLDEFRKQGNGRHIPVVAVTARAMKGDREHILAYGFDAYISKPVEAELLEKTIRELIDGD